MNAKHAEHLNEVNKDTLWVGATTREFNQLLEYEDLDRLKRFAATYANTTTPRFDSCTNIPNHDWMYTVYGDCMDELPYNMPTSKRQTSSHYYLQGCDFIP
jgi:hypothetical protein